LGITVLDFILRHLYIIGALVILKEYVVVRASDAVMEVARKSGVARV